MEMVGNASLLPGIIHVRRDPAKKNSQATGLRRAITVLTGVTSAALLGACSGSLPFLAGIAADGNVREMTPAEARADARSTRAARAAVATGKPERMRAVTVQQILTEWGTLPLAKGSYRRGGPSSVSQARNPMTIPEQDYSLSLQEIMTNAACRSCEDKPYHRQVLQASNLHGVPPALIHAVIQKESAYNPAATSKRQARGLMQVTPGTGRYMGVEDSRSLYDPQTNINAGTAYLKYLMDSHDTVDEVLAAYNSGPANVRKYRGVPPFDETRRYVRDVKKFFASTTKSQPE
jgi:soluble lytic murein transglycosylase-like protein